VSVYLTLEAVQRALEELRVKRIPRLDEIPPDDLIAEGIDPHTLLPYET